MELKDQFKYLVASYYGMMEMDEYELKVYTLKDIENYIRNFIEQNPILNYDYGKEAEKIKEETSLKTKLQDLLLVLPKIDAPIELTLLVKQRIKKITEQL